MGRSRGTKVAIKGFPEKEMWCAVIMQAWMDATEMRRGDEHSDSKKDAIRFLTSSVPGWKEWRSEVCDLAGIPAGRLRTKFLEFMNTAVTGGMNVQENR